MHRHAPISTHSSLPRFLNLVSPLVPWFPLGQEYRNAFIFVKDSPRSSLKIRGARINPGPSYFSRLARVDAEPRLFYLLARRLTCAPSTRPLTVLFEMVPPRSSKAFSVVVPV